MSVTAPPASGRHAVVMRSTVPPGTGAGVVAPVFADAEPPAGLDRGHGDVPGVPA